MLFRETTKDDLAFCATHGISGGKFDSAGETVVETVTLESDGLIIAIGGIVKITETTAWAWVELTPFALDSKLNIWTLVQTINKWSVACAELNGIYRYQAWIDVDSEKSISFARHLGFKEESIMADFLGKGRHALLYVKNMDDVKK